MACFQWQPHTPAEEQCFEAHAAPFSPPIHRGPAAPANRTAGQRAWWQTLSNGGAVRDIYFEDDTEMTLRKHALAKNKHVCEVRLKAP